MGGDGEGDGVCWLWRGGCVGVMATTFKTLIMSKFRSCELLMQDLGIAFASIAASWDGA